MFTGIIEAQGQVEALENHGSNLDIRMKSKISSEFKIDQSVSHNGVCLTVVDVQGSSHTVTAVEETLTKSNLGSVVVGDQLNLERSMLANGRFDGHIVQGHVDTIGECLEIQEMDGSWQFQFGLDHNRSNLLVEKGSVCINGISLTCFDVTADTFRVAIIPYTYENTNMNSLKVGDKVNYEFDILGKYIQKLLGSEIRG